MAILPHIDSDSDTLSRNCHSTAARPRDMPKQGAGVPAGERCLSQWLKSRNKERCRHCYHTRCMATEPHKPCHKQMLWLLPFRITVLRQREWLQQMLSASRKPVDVVANPKPECSKPGILRQCSAHGLQMQQKLRFEVRTKKHNNPEPTINDHRICDPPRKWRGSRSPCQRYSASSGHTWKREALGV